MKEKAPPRETGRLSLERCREILGADAPADEASLAMLRDQAYDFARVIFAHAIQQKRPGRGNP